tara:strand:+ start:769 stop:1380 length:612 start_codon:yes stop_codon:yes gene_type:complete
MLFFAYKTKDLALGDKLIPIEIIEISSKPSKGEYFPKPKEHLKTLNKDNKRKQKDSRKDEQNKILDNKKNRVIDKNKIIKNEKNYSLNSSDKKVQKYEGNEGKILTKEIEKGSLKGDGLAKITCLNCIKPTYPKLALMRGYEGILKLKILIEKNGTVKNVTIIKSTGYKILDKSGIDAAKKSKFYPLKEDRTLNVEYSLYLNR